MAGVADSGTDATLAGTVILQLPPGYDLYGDAETTSEPANDVERIQQILRILSTKAAKIATDTDGIQYLEFDYLSLSPIAQTAILSMTQDLEDAIQAASDQSETRLIIGTATSVMLSAGFVIWLLKIGALVSAAAGTSPLWRIVDPVPIVNQARAMTGIDGASTDDDDRQAA